MMMRHDRIEWRTCWRGVARAATYILLLLVLLMAWAARNPGEAQAPRHIVASDNARHAGEFVVPLDKSQIIRVDQPVTDLLVGNPEIADVLAITDRRIYVLGKKLGATSLTIYGKKRRLIAVADLVVSLDVDGLKTRLYELLPDEDIEVRPANGAVVLSGRVSSSAAMSRALAVAERYAPTKVTNLMTVSGSQQVMLEVRFAEVTRSLAEDIGFNLSIIDSDFQFLSGDALLTGTISPNAFAATAASATIGDTALDVIIDALERKGVVKTLAEPNLVALSGDTASFLAGGEFPVPVAQESDSGAVTITVEFKEFGVSLAFTPTVLEEGLINLLVSPEVSRIDQTNSVVNQGFVIPGLTTRRATTTIELRDGQSFAIAGLIQSDFQDTIRQVPGLGDVPVLSALVRSSEFQRNETELVIIVTPRLVKPAPAGTLATPADGFIPPSRTDIVLFGRTEGKGSGRLADATGALGARNAGGLVGTYGHIIE